MVLNNPKRSSSVATPDGDEAGRGPPGKERPEPLRALHVILDQVVADAAKEVDLQTGNSR
jgi:hypothetical protein